MEIAEKDYETVRQLVLKYGAETIEAAVEQIESEVEDAESFVEVIEIFVLAREHTRPNTRVDYEVFHATTDLTRDNAIDVLRGEFNHDDYLPDIAIVVAFTENVADETFVAAEMIHAYTYNSRRKTWIEVQPPEKLPAIAAALLEG